MAKGKGKKSTSSGEPHKKHGPKRHMFKAYKPMIKTMADAGLLTKYNDFESWVLACQSKGKKIVTKHEFNEFLVLPLAEKKNYFKHITK